MRNLFYAASLLLGLNVLLSSCDKSGTESEISSSGIIGYWIYGDSVRNGKVSLEFDSDLIDEYLEFTKDGLVKDYFPEDNYGWASYKDGVLSYDGDWYLDEVYKYRIEDGHLRFEWDNGDVRVSEYIMISKDKFCLTEEYNGNIREEYYLRVKKFSK